MDPRRHKTARRIARLVVAIAAGIVTFVFLLVLFDQRDTRAPAPFDVLRKGAEAGK